MPLDSSTEIEAVAGETDAGSETDVKSTESSSEEATKPDVEKTPLEVVEEALLSGAETSSDSEDGTEQSQSTDTKADADAEAKGDKDGNKDSEKSGEDELPDLTDEEIASYPENSQRRIRELSGKFRDEETKVSELQPKADQWDRVNSFLEEHKIQPKEVDNALEITRLINSSDFGKALELIGPIHQHLLEKTGGVLPDDLAEDVRLGHITKVRAQELHKSNSDAANATARETQVQQQKAVDKEAQDQQDHVTEMSTAGDDWSKTKKSSDPDWHMKQDLVAEQVELELARVGAEGFPKNKQEVFDLSEAALKIVEERLKKFQPKPAAKNMVTDSHASSRSTAKPTNPMEAMEQGLAAAASEASG